MSEKTESEDFEDDEDDASEIDSDDGDIEFLISDLRQKRSTAPPGEPAWRKLEKYREEKHTAELLSDFDDYDIGDAEDAEHKPSPR